MTIEYNPDHTIIKLDVKIDFRGCKDVCLSFSDFSVPTSIDSIHLISVYYNRAGSIRDVSVCRGYDRIDFDSSQVVSLFSRYASAYVPDLLRFFADRVSCVSSFIL